jgi:glycosyltransferase involved in cell wall biosynthesis
MFRLKRNLKCIGKIEPNIIWTRDAWCAYLILKEFKDVKIVLEVHGRSNIIFYKFLKKYIDRIFFCPINEINRVYILNLLPRARVLIAPMGIDKHIVANKLQVKKFISSLKQRDISKIKIAYIGKFAPQGYSKGVEDLIYLAQKSQQRKSFTVTLLGATKKEEIEYLKLKDDLGISSRYLNIIKHVPHSMALRAMRDFDILVLPLPNNSIYQGMPIKLLEYFASGRVTILAESNLLKELFKFDFSPFFYKKHDSESLYQAIQEVLQCKDLEKKIQSCINFASKHTWEKRTKDIVDFISR